ncbi:MAG: alpha-L-fucosidase [Spirochaetales bacterium]|nr:alpha-L-fucosidase [Spirochaetales bacterium]
MMGKYQPTLESITNHSLPDWYDDAKLGIFVHYGLYSVPGWAVVSEGDIIASLKKSGWAGSLPVNPYAEWYLNTLRIKGSPTAEYHRKTYGAEFTYDDFTEGFNKENEKWNPEAWAVLFERIGARYVVLTSKHCESFNLWPTSYPNPFKKNYTAKRDIVGELASAVRSHKMRMGIYYSGGYDWCFNIKPITTAADLGLSVPQSLEYVDYCTNHWHELIDRYQPSVMWGDVGYPVKADIPELFSHYYNKVPDGVINDRFYQVDLGRMGKLMRLPGLRTFVDRTLTKAFIEGKTTAPSLHSDFTTPEYTSNPGLLEKKWETCRGLGYSFGYNRNETSEHMLSVKDLVQMFVDIVSRNGNLLLNVAPMADGTIPTLQLQRLEGLGEWLAVNGEAIFGTRPWHTAEGQTREGIDVRFTQKADTLYAVLLGTPSGVSVTLKDMWADPEMEVKLPGTDILLGWRQERDGITILFPSSPPYSPALALKLTPKPSKVES